jgi:hypothetical protein
MKTIKILGIPLVFFIYLIIVMPFQSCDPEDDCEDEPQCDTCVMVYKPNIYIYPEEDIQLAVKLDFPMGGKIVTSIPEYVNSWNITVDKNGLINNIYSYLFYESTQPDIWQKNNGWIMEKTELEAFFRSNMTAYGFLGQEIEDFIDYWIPRLDNYGYYSICPQTAELIDKVIKLSFSKQPENILRLFYVIEGFDNLPEIIVEPTINSFERKNFFVTEWGVVLK